MTRARAAIPTRTEMQEEKERLKLCKLYCGNIRGYKDEIRNLKQIRNERIDAFNMYLDEIGNEVDGKIASAQRDTVDAIVSIASTRNARSAIDAAVSIANAIRSVRSITAENGKYQSEIRRLARGLNKAFLQIDNYREDLNRTTKLARENNCSCVR